MQTLAPERRWLLAFRPVIWWALGSVLLLAWDFHHTRAAWTTVVFHVRVENEKPDAAYTAKLDGKPFLPGQRVGLGGRTLMIEGRDCEPFSTNLFVWYGRRDLGDLRLVRSRGTLDLKVVPTAKEVQVAGRISRTNLVNSVGARLVLPVDEYSVTATFEHLTEQRTIRVRRNETTPLDIKPALVVLALASDPTGAVFRLRSQDRKGLRVDGTLPVDIPGLPLGDYLLRVSQEDYVKEQLLRLTAAQATNQVKVVFDYGAVTLVSEPAGAKVLAGDRDLGRTPLTLSRLKPGPYVFRLELPEYSPVDVRAEVKGNDSISLQAALLSRRYTEAMERARGAVNSSFPDYEQALAAVQEALQAKPDDDAATKLKTDLEFALHLRAAKAAESTQDFVKAASEAGAALNLKPGDQDASAVKDRAARAGQDSKDAAAKVQAEARKRHPEEVFRRETADRQHADLFDARLMVVHGELGKVKDAVLRAFAKAPRWDLGGVQAPDQETFVIAAGNKGFLQGKRNVVLVGGQATDDEVHLHFKLWDYALGTQIKINLFQGVSDESYVPVHPSRYHPENPALAKARRDEAEREFVARLKSELP